MVDPVISVKNLSVTFISRTLFRKAKRVDALVNVFLDVKEGERFGIAGESGSGKSTLARAIVGLMRPSSGEISFGGEALRSPANWRRIYPRKIQLVSQDPFGSLDPRQRIVDSMVEPLFVNRMITNRDDANAMIRSLFERIGLRNDLLGYYPHQLSGGQRQRVAIARAVMLEPQLLILDEPTSSLDVSTQAQIIELLKQLQVKQKFTYLFISHNLELLWHVSDRIAVMQHGRVVETGDRDAIFQSPRDDYTKQLISSIRV